MEPITVLLADDVTMFRRSFPLLLNMQEGIHVVDTAANGNELIQKVDELKPGVVITDIQMPDMNGIEATKILLKKLPGLPIIGLTQFEDHQQIVEMMEAGAKGYILKTNETEEVVQAIQAVHKGLTYCCSSTSLRLLKSIAGSKSISIRKMNRETFSNKEIEIIQLICEQYATKEIAPKIHLTESTVERYRVNIMEKTGSRNLAGIVVYAIKNGIFRV
jgi:DNA-binding NarL/FixJ family response regulator